MRGDVLRFLFCFRVMIVTILLSMTATYIKRDRDRLDSVWAAYYVGLAGLFWGFTRVKKEDK